MNDLYFIKKLEKKLNIEAVKQKVLKTYGKNKVGMEYQIDNEGRVKALRIASMDITDIPELIYCFKNLKYLFITNNKIEYVPEFITRMSLLEKLYLDGNRITTLPDGISQLYRMRYLSLDNNQLTELSSSIGNLKNLEYISLSDNKLTSLPEFFINFTDLSILNMRNNELNLVPDWIADFKKLEVLYLGNNQISYLPKNVEDLNSLKKLHLQNNKFTIFPECICEIKSLESLWLDKNQITIIPNNIGNLQNLKELRLDNNRILEIPETIGALNKLELLNLKNNLSLLSPPPSVVKMGLNAIKSYFNNEMVKSYTCKMVVVGEGGVGKTCLLDALENKDFNACSITTHGIDIRKLIMPLNVNESVNVELNIWDFGGQDIYHATHQFYLTDHSLFILVWSARSGYESSKVYKWLETIKLLAPNSPILIVATNSKDRGADLPKGDLIKKYGEKICFLEIDNENKQGIDELKIAIMSATKEIKYMGMCRPSSWMKAREQINNLPDKYISEENLFKVFAVNKIDPNSFQSLARYLHELGDILYYPEEDELRDSVILKPSWVSQYIAKVLDSETVSKEGGFLGKSLMKEIWNDLTNDMRQKFVVLMEKFDLSYSVPDDEDKKCLIVEKLKYEEHLEYKERWYNFKGDNEITFKYKLDAIPAGIPTWFIARTHRFSILIHWRTGAVLVDNKDNPKHMGLIITDLENKEVWLSVKGEQPSYFFMLLRDTLEHTFNRFRGLNVVTYIPCRGIDEKHCSHFFMLKHLEDRLSKKPPKQSIECPEEMMDVSVMELLYGISYGGRKDDIGKQIAEMVAGEIMPQIRSENEELRKLIQLEFFKSYQVQQATMDCTCPNLFTLTPVDSNWMQRSLETNDFELQLFCQKPGCMHAAEHGKYKIKVSKKWLSKISVYYNKMVPILKMVLPIAAPGVGSFLKNIDLEDYDWISKTAGEVGKAMQKNKSERLYLDSTHESIYADGAELRILNELLTKIDSVKKWGGLQRVITPEGHILWLCEEHKNEYRL